MKNTLTTVIIFGIISALLAVALWQVQIAGIIFGIFVSILASSVKKISATEIIKFNLYSGLAYSLSYAVVFIAIMRSFAGHSLLPMPVIFFVAGIVGGAVFSYAFKFIHYVDNRSVMLLIGTSAVVSSVGAVATLPDSLAYSLPFLGSGFAMYLPLFLLWNLAMMFLCSRMLRINYPAPNNTEPKVRAFYRNWIEAIAGDDK
jgi:hypothetical protein